MTLPKMHMMNLQPRTQKFVVWWCIVFFAIYGVIGVTLLPMIPPLPPSWSAAQVAHYFQEHATHVKIGAFIDSWVGAAWAPFFVVVALQMYRHEKLQNKLPVWTAILGATGVMTSIFLVLPPIFWGVAAFTATRAPEITTIMHELATLSMITTDQYFIFGWVGICIVCLTPNNVLHTPFTRSFGYFYVWCTLLEEFSALCWLGGRTGLLAWNGLLPFWIPLTTTAIWFPVTVFVLIKAINAQASDTTGVAQSRHNAVTTS